ncbi:hypothetical protein BTH41_05078 [Bacillus mycoides]|nr:hypothetical protein BTH41_05078 [Bacillus mycoides]
MAILQATLLYQRLFIISLLLYVHHEHVLQFIIRSFLPVRNWAL